MKDWTGQQYDEAALADPTGGRADYDANLIRDLSPGVSLNISGPVGSQRSAARCRTGFVLSENATCERCGAARDEACRSTTNGTAGVTAGVEPARPTQDADMAALLHVLKSRYSDRPKPTRRGA